MKELSLVADTPAQKKVKEYLEQNASDILADKINNGVKVEREGKTLINKKTLDGFMNYATEEARKQAEQGARCACIEDDVVYGWAVHYFEEDSIEGKLYNEDGTEYKKPTPKKAEKKTTPKPTPKPTPTVETPPAKEKPSQMTFFDFS